MKVLYWNRIQIFQKSEAIWFDVNEPDIQEDFVSMFAKQVTAPKKDSDQKVKESKKGRPGRNRGQ